MTGREFNCLERRIQAERHRIHSPLQVADLKSAVVPRFSLVEWKYTIRDL
jgi:hypothetical protein